MRLTTVKAAYSGQVHAGGKQIDAGHLEHTRDPHHPADVQTSWLRSAQIAPAERECWVNACRRVADSGGQHKLPHI